MLCVWVHGCDPGRVSDGSRLALYQTLSIECPSSIVFWHVLLRVVVPFAVSVLFLFLFLFFFFFFFFFFHACRYSSDLFEDHVSSRPRIEQTTYRIGNHVYYWVVWLG